MSPFLRKVRTASGTMAVQIAVNLDLECVVFLGLGEFFFP